MDYIAFKTVVYKSTTATFPALLGNIAECGGSAEK